MAKTSTTKTATEEVVEVVEETSEVVEKVNESSKKNTKKVIEPLEDYDEIEVVSLIPNVDYQDNRTGDMYEWDEVGHVEYMTFETLKNMWRNYKGYFKNMWLKPNDDRVINKFGLTRTYDKYEFLMDESNYTQKNIDEICSAISSMPNGLKISICSKIRNMVINGQVSNVSVIKKLETHLKIDLIEFL